MLESIFQGTWGSYRVLPPGPCIRKDPHGRCGQTCVNRAQGHLPHPAFASRETCGCPVSGSSAGRVWPVQGGGEAEEGVGGSPEGWSPGPAVRPPPDPAQLQLGPRGLLGLAPQRSRSGWCLALCFCFGNEALWLAAPESGTLRWVKRPSLQQQQQQQHRLAGTRGRWALCGRGESASGPDPGSCG